jgi:hypothetical protein
LRKILRIQCHDEISFAPFSAGADGIVARIRGDVWKSRGRDMFRLFTQEIDYLTDDWTTDSQPPQDSFVFQKNLITH